VSDTNDEDVDVDLPEDAPDPEEVEPEAADSAIEEGAKGDSAGLPLRVEGLQKSFGGITAVDGATFSVEEGSLTGLIGPNGAGKSTTFNCITGVHRPDSGDVYFRGDEITGVRPHAIAQSGLVRTFQIARELDEMTVLENMMLAPGLQRGESITRSVLRGSAATSSTRRWRSARTPGRPWSSSKSTTSPTSTRATSRAASANCSNSRGR